MKVLVANRGEIACRILRTLRELGVPSVALRGPADSGAPHPDLADETVRLQNSRDYLDAAALLGAARSSGATALHPGYGFLSQSADFARACEGAGLAFLGPSPESMSALGDKRGSRKTAESLGIRVVPGARDVEDCAAAAAAAERLGYPILLKAAGGGGGKGMRLVLEKAGLQEAFDAASREGRASFGDDRLIVEKHVSPARHVEVQILGDGREAVAVGDRECSLQRRYQKVIEEGPAAAVSPAVREEMHRSAVKLARAVGYRSAGTVEFLLGPEGLPYFLEVNTRLQVEHPVTEATTGLDLVAEQIELARGGALPAPDGPRGHAIEARVNAEDPHSGFLPQAGRVLMTEWPQRPGVRVDSGVREGSDVPPDYDPLLAKVIAWGKDREQARRRLVEALRESVLLGLATNLSFLLQVLESGFFIRGETFTTTLESVAWPRPPVPAAAAEAARRAASPGTPPAEPRSPWQSMGGFRVGS